LVRKHRTSCCGSTAEAWGMTRWSLAGAGAAAEWEVESQESACKRACMGAWVHAYA